MTIANQLLIYLIIARKVSVFAYLISSPIDRAGNKIEFIRGIVFQFYLYFFFVSMSV